MVTSQYGMAGSSPRPPGPQGSSTSRPRSTTQPALPTNSPAGPPPDHGSPQAVHPHSIAARRILTPKSPRTAGPSRATMSIRSWTLTSRGISAVLQLRPKRQTRGTVTNPADIEPFQVALSAQPGPGIRQTSADRTDSVGRDKTGSWRPVGPVRPSLPCPVPDESASQHVRWLGRCEVDAGNRFGVSDCAVDVHQGSRQADQKRQRNAGASARFRQRKKEREREQQEEMQKLDAENRELARRNEELVKRCQELEAHRDFYRNDRNRLRDALSRLPGGREWAERGPPSPVMTTTMPEPLPPDSNTLQLHQPPPSLLPPTSGAPHQHPEPHSQFRQQGQQQQHHAPPVPTPSRPVTAPREPHHIRPASYSDVSILEPPARRRRTDSEPQLPSSYRLVSQQQYQQTTPPGSESPGLRRPSVPARHTAPSTFFSPSTHGTPRTSRNLSSPAAALRSTTPPAPSSPSRTRRGIGTTGANHDADRDAATSPSGSTPSSATSAFIDRQSICNVNATSTVRDGMGDSNSAGGHIVDK
ncbi:hypothetical protein VTJ49DRAFT_805 [Mycothermus thermophilus]|uniref:BZIP domain-containing protein n=1 Tax=Humicola insolens TaxID=85995 RepID=A0ABR3VE61_HUMIN